MLPLKEVDRHLLRNLNRKQKNLEIKNAKKLHKKIQMQRTCTNSVVLKSTRSAHIAGIGRIGRTFPTTWAGFTKPRRYPTLRKTRRPAVITIVMIQTKFLIIRIELSRHTSSTLCGSSYISHVTAWTYFTCRKTWNGSISTF